MSRDIRDLKARLGLEKKGSQGQRPSGGLVAPPGVRSPTSGPVPVPPGAKPPPPVLPDAKEDPFAYMEAIAKQGRIEQEKKGPEIVVVNDGAPVEKVDQKSRAIALAKIAALIILPLAIGITVGQISQSAKTVNRTIEDAKVLQELVKTYRTAVKENVLDELLRAKERGPGRNQFLSSDKELTEKLLQPKVLPEFGDDAKVLVYHSYMYHLESSLVENVLEFFSGVEDLRKAVSEHAKAAHNDESAIAKGKEKVDATKRYGVIVDVPTEKKKDVQFGARIVEVGQPVCEDNNFGQDGKCPGNILGFGYREGTANGEGWGKKSVATPQGDFSDKLLTVVPTAIFEELVKGPDASVAEAAYLRRVNELFTKAEALVELGVFVEGKLSSKSKQSKSFTFFL